MSKTCSQTPPPLTARQREYLSHLRAWTQHGGTLKAYASTHGLSVSALYTVQRVLQRKGVWRRHPAPEEPVRMPTLVPVQLSAGTPARAAFRIVVSNCVTVEVPADAEPARCAALVRSLAEALR